MKRTPQELELRKIFADALRKFMKQRGFSAVELAQGLGVSRQALYKYLWGKTMPSMAVLLRAARLGLIFKFHGIAVGPDVKSSPKQHAILGRSLDDSSQ